ncbi:MAG: tetratricopeptide repeat protein [Thalassobaculaceae bacterium]
MELTIEQALQNGVAAHKEGRLQDAERLYRAILQSQPAHPDANHNLGVLAVSVNKAEAALPLFKTALEGNPKVEQFWLSYIDALIKEKQFENATQVFEQAKMQGLAEEKLNALEAQLVSISQTKNANSANPSQYQVSSLLEHYQNGRLIDAEKLAIEITQEFPEHQFAWKVLGAVLGATGRKSEAVDANQTAVELSPQDAAAHYNLGVILQELGRLDEAEASYDQAIALKPDYAVVHNNLGNTLKELGRLDEAEASYNQAITLKPDYAEAHCNLGITLHEIGRLDEAEASYSQAMALKPDFAEAHNDLGNTLKELGRLDEAEASYNQAIALKPDYANAHLNLCELLEKMNRTDELLSFIRSDCRKIWVNKAEFLYYEALTEFRKENYQTAAELVEKININELPEMRRTYAMKLQGDVYHHKKNYSAAFEAYKAKNKYAKNSLEYKKQEPEKYFIQQREKVAQIEQLQGQTAYKSVIKPSWIQPTFLIGFPRSGTTLLDTILRTHSNIDVLEELPMMQKMNAIFADPPTISMIEAMDNTGAEIASGYYFEELKKHIKVGSQQTLVDKLPLNILQLPLINQVFPNAKYIVALRHPLDCVLSCWMQEFNLNSAMANMVELERIVEFYDVAMSILKLSQERYSLNTHRIRYEDLIVDFDENIASLLMFLNLKWEKELRSYQKTALARGRINTPSYSQVVKPIYSTASYRWENYEEYLEPYKSRLAPWIQEYGY